MTVDKSENTMIDDGIILSEIDVFCLDWTKDFGSVEEKLRTGARNELIPIENDILIVKHSLEYMRIDHSFLNFEQYAALSNAQDQFKKFFRWFAAKVDDFQSGNIISEMNVYDAYRRCDNTYVDISLAAEPIKLIIDKNFSHCLHNVCFHIYNYFVVRRNRKFETRQDIVNRISNLINVALISSCADINDRKNLCKEIFDSVNVEITRSFGSTIAQIPAAPPGGETFDKRPEGESAPEFIQRVYGRWLTGEFTRADLRKIDPKADMGLYNWERSHGRSPLNLPTKKERNDQLLAQIGSEGKPEAAKLHDALRARKRRERVPT